MVPAHELPPPPPVPVRSPPVAIRGEIEMIVKDLLRLNHNIEADEIRWVPSLDHVVKQLKGTADNVPAQQETYLVKIA